MRIDGKIFNRHDRGPLLATLYRHRDSGGSQKKIVRLRTDIPGAHWVQTEQIHLTLVFLGEVEDAVAAQLNIELGRIHLPEFELCFSGTGCFPNRHRPRVLWIGLEQHPYLDQLAAMVRAAVKASGIPAEERPFSPHVTLARLKLVPPREVDLFFDQPQKPKLHCFRVREFNLFQSRLTPQGALHVPLRSFPLAAA